MIAVTFALPAESSGFLRRLHKKSRTNRNGIGVIRGQIDNPEIGAREPFRNRTIEVLHIADLLTVPSMIESREERDRMAQTTGAVAADMETEFIARACAEHAIPLLSLRVISDTPSKPFPAPANVLFNMERQQTDLTKLTLHFLKHPRAIPRLIAFARKIVRARGILTNAILGVVGAIE